MFTPSRIALLMALLLAVLAGPPRAHAFALNGYRWPAGTNIVMHLQLTHPTVAFQDGSASWNASAADALNIWNQHVDTVHFVEGGPAAAGDGDGINTVFFSNTIYGESFGNFLLAITLYHSQDGGTFSETDIIFNSARRWNSYRGPIQEAGRNTTFDFHRVALHEFGHALGLGHPDESGQNVSALMNSQISDLDSLEQDDIAGARALYGLRITSSLNPPGVRSGDPFSYQITADNNPSNYSASGLPPGLQLDADTGLISGRCSSSGTFPVDVVVQGALGTATGRIQIFVFARLISSTSSPAEVPLGSNFTYQIEAPNNPTSFSASGLPPGLSVDPATGVISGTSTASGTFFVMVRAQGPSSVAEGFVRIVIFPPRITSNPSPPSVEIGSSFSYQITASHSPTSFAASGLPAGLQLDAATGRITGVPELSGSYPVQVTTRGTTGDASGTIYLTILRVEISTPPIAKIPLSVSGAVVADPVRPRIYAATNDGVAVVDTASLSVIETIPMSSLYLSDMTISADGKKLWVSGYYRGDIRSVDLTTLQALPALSTSQLPFAIREGSDGRLYVSDWSNAGVFQLDASSGATLARFGPTVSGNPSWCSFELSPDRRTLYVAENSFASLERYDLTAATTPFLLQRIVQSGDSVGRRPAVNPNGQSVAIFTYGSFGRPDPVVVRSAGDLTVVRGSFSLPGFPGELSFSSDGAFLFQTIANGSIHVFETTGHTPIRTITLPDRALTSSAVSSLAVDKDSAYLFATGTRNGNIALYVYPVVPPRGPATPPRTLLNVSTRLRTQTGDNVLIGGFILNGSEPKRVLLRAVGPSLPVPGTVADPALTLHNASGAVIASDDNWNAHRADVLATELAPQDEHESAIIATLEPGAYTAILRGINQTTGVALVELYDLTPGSSSRIANISTRGRVETGDNVMIGGFIIGGDQPTRVIVRAIGPSLTGRGVPGALADTTLSLHDGNGTLFAQNDDWQSEQGPEIMASALPPNDPREAAIVRTLPPGNYTAIVRGKGETTGVALVEVYNLENN